MLSAISTSIDWGMWSECCSKNASTVYGYANVYRKDRDCVGQYCITNNTTLSGNWGECLKSAYDDKVAEMHDRGEDIDTISTKLYDRCEWIDYDLIKKGARPSSAPAQGLVNTSTLWALLLVILLLLR